MHENKDNTNEDFDIEDIKRYINISVEKKLNYLEEINDFFNETIPQKNKDTWKMLKQEGW
jgi:hypothetical protein